MVMCGIDDPELPDTGGGCCMGADVYGPGRCTCWREVYDRDQAPPVPGERVVRPEGMCSDCAYRPGSPEKNDDPEFRAAADDLEAWAASGTPFHCHDGMRLLTNRRHPSGAEVPGRPGGYDPPIHDGVPYRADGAPGYLCAGWDARRRALQAREW